MTSINVTQARSKLYQLISEVNMNSEPVTLTNNRGGNCVLVSESDWRAIQETLYLNSVPGMAESILEADREAETGKVYDPDEEW
ncbi:MAG: type II toxin-antitoxin system Phd/YefM family antitoxin [Clostridia bacterium]|nr:type II toxin-antitoxin system Phd/YefM family antitoxin [Clostridia bacterium]